MLEDGRMIDALFGQLLTLARDPDLGFSALAIGWGRGGSDEWNANYARFCRSMRLLAKRCPVKFWNKSYYAFNGKIYEVVPDMVVTAAYNLLLEHLCISAVMNRPAICKTTFLDTIACYNTLCPRFDIVAFSNGVVDFGVKGTPEVHPFSPEFHVTYYHPYDYNPKAKCTRWLSFLHEVLPDKNSRLILQMFLGLGLISRGDAYNPYEGKMSEKIELCLLLVGQGANGKSVIFDVACALFGRDRISNMGYDDLTADGDEGMRGRYPIRNAIFNWTSDEDGRKFGRKNTGMFKRLVSGEPVPFRKLGENVLRSNTIPYLVFNLNELPLPKDASLGFIRRLQYISFDVTIPPDRRNPLLSSQLIANEMSGIFNWVMRGSAEIRRRKFQFPAAEGSRRQLLLSLLGSQPVLAWVRAYELRSTADAPKEISTWITCKELYNSFTQFCYDNDVPEGEVLDIRMFGRIMWQKCCFFRKRTPAGVSYEIYGATERDLKEHILLSTMNDGTPVEAQESFIKDDD